MVAAVRTVTLNEALSAFNDTIVVEQGTKPDEYIVRLKEYPEIGTVIHEQIISQGQLGTAVAELLEYKTLYQSELDILESQFGYKVIKAADKGTQLTNEEYGIDPITVPRFDPAKHKDADGNPDSIGHAQEAVNKAKAAANAFQDKILAVLQKAQTAGIKENPVELKGKRYLQFDTNIAEDTLGYAPFKMDVKKLKEVGRTLNGLQGQLKRHGYNSGVLSSLKLPKQLENAIDQKEGGGGLLEFLGTLIGTIHEAVKHQEKMQREFGADAIQKMRILQIEDRGVHVIDTAQLSQIDKMIEQRVTTVKTFFDLSQKMGNISSSKFQGDVTYTSNDTGVTVTIPAVDATDKYAEHRYIQRFMRENDQLLNINNRLNSILDALGVQGIDEESDGRRTQTLVSGHQLRVVIPNLKQHPEAFSLVYDGNPDQVNEVLIKDKEEIINHQILPAIEKEMIAKGFTLVGASDAATTYRLEASGATIDMPKLDVKAADALRVAESVIAALGKADVLLASVKTQDKVQTVVGRMSQEYGCVVNDNKLCSPFTVPRSRPLAVPLSGNARSGEEFISNASQMEKTMDAIALRQAEMVRRLKDQGYQVAAVTSDGKTRISITKSDPQFSAEFELHGSKQIMSLDDQIKLQDQLPQADRGKIAIAKADLIKIAQQAGAGKEVLVR